MQRVRLGDAAPELQPLKLLAPATPYEIRAEFDVVYHGGYVVLYWIGRDGEFNDRPSHAGRSFEMTVAYSFLGVDLSLSVALEHLSGRFLAIVPAGVDPLITLAFR